MPAYWESMHGEVPFHLRRIASERDAEDGWRDSARLHSAAHARTALALLRSVLRELDRSPSRAHCDYCQPGHLVTTVLGFAVAALYFGGWLRLGVLLAIFVEVLDGVDGKLARITRTTSKAGEYEHILDFFYENSWWLALGRFLSRRGSPSAWTAAMLMVAFDLTDNIVYSIADVKWGIEASTTRPRSCPGSDLSRAAATSIRGFSCRDFFSARPHFHFTWRSRGLG